jgi:replicative DNA helicase
MSARQDLTPPHSDEAEHAVLGAMLLDQRSIDDVSCVLDAGRFYHPQHRAIYSTVLQLHTANKAVDVLTVHEAGGHDLQYLNDMAQACPTARHVGRYAEIVAECWAERELIRVGSEIAEDGARRTTVDQPIAERIDRGVAALMAVAKGDTENEPETIASAAITFIDRLNDRYEGKETSIGTGLRDLDKITAGGGRHGELWVIGARPSMGKTALTLTVSRNVAKDRDVLFCSQEDSKDSASSRFVASIGRVSLSHLRDPKHAPESMWAAVSDAVEQMQALRLHIDDQAGLTLLDVRRKIQQVRRRGGLDLVIIDYLQLMTGESSNRNQELGLIANGLKKTAKDLKVWIILLSQMNREADKRTGPPQMSDLRDSGATTCETQRMRTSTTQCCTSRSKRTVPRAWSTCTLMAPTSDSPIGMGLLQARGSSVLHHTQEGMTDGERR